MQKSKFISRLMHSWVMPLGLLEFWFIRGMFSHPGTSAHGQYGWVTPYFFGHYGLCWVTPAFIYSLAGLLPAEWKKVIRKPHQWLRTDPENMTIKELCLHGCKYLVLALALAVSAVPFPLLMNPNSSSTNITIGLMFIFVVIFMCAALSIGIAIYMWLRALLRWMFPKVEIRTY